jgi:ABC-type multidrug transport system fused ATPase/permease subunit
VPTSGVVQIDSILISDYTLKSLRKAIAYSPQSPQIFDGTVKDHIRYGKSDATNEEVIEAAKLAGVDTFIDRLPDGYDTFLGEDAVRLSGGQKQRLDLARTLVSEPQIMIFDEPTSNLDVDSEEMFRKTIERIRRKTNTTIIIVAHRLSSIFDSDQIIVLNQGRVESTGKHIDLIQQGGWYERAWAIQDRET